MRPVLFSILGLDIQTYGVSKALAALAGAYLLGRAFERLGQPEAAGLAGYNELLLARCDGLAAAEHYRKAVPISELFTADVAACLALPGVGFDPVRYESRTTDKTGNLAIDGNTYAAGPALGARRVTVGLRHDRIEILDEHARPVVSLPRVFGHQAATVFDPASLLPLLVRKPGTWGNSPVRDRVGGPLRNWLDAAPARPRRDVLIAIGAATVPAGFDNAVAAAEAIIGRGEVPEMAALGMLARRLAAGAEPAASTVNLAVYDGLTHPTDATDATEPVPA